MITKVEIKFDKLLGETPKAYLLLIHGVEYWFAKKILWNFITNKKLGGHAEIPTWLYIEKFGCKPKEEEATMIVIKHIPTKIEVKEIKPCSELMK